MTARYSNEERRTFMPKCAGVSHRFEEIYVQVMKARRRKMSVLIVSCSEMFRESTAGIRSNRISELQHGSGRKIDGEHVGKAIDKIVKDFIWCEHRCS